MYSADKQKQQPTKKTDAAISDERISEKTKRANKIKNQKSKEFVDPVSRCARIEQQKMEQKSKAKLMRSRRSDDDDDDDYDDFIQSLGRVPVETDDDDDVTIVTKL